MFELTPEAIKTILENNQKLCVKRINMYFGPFDTRIFSKSKYKKLLKEGKLLEPSGFTGSFFEGYSKKSDQKCFDGNDISAVISLSIPGAGYWVASLLNEKINLSYFSMLEYNTCISEVGEDFFDQPQMIEIYEKLRKINGIGRVAASKLLASKRPNLFPVFDKDVSSLFLHSDGISWQERGSYSDWCKNWRTVMADSDVKVLLSDISAETNKVCQPLRALDVIFWLEAQEADPEKKIEALRTTL